MAKFKAAGSRKSPGARSNLAVVPCALLVLTAAAILAFLFYEMLKQGS
jgi:hypothetical protein